MEFQRKTRSSPLQLLGIVTLFLVMGTSGCDGISTKASSSGCSAKSAHINVYDSQVARVCGCTEGAGTFAQSGTLNCTVPFGTTVYFYFVGISTTHQISTTIGTTQPISPTDSVKTAALIMSQVGAISFVDSSNGFTGTITVTP